MCHVENAKWLATALAIFGLIGITELCLAFFLFRQRQDFIRKGKRTVGVIVSLEQKNLQAGNVCDVGRTMLVPVVEYTSEDGKIRRYTSSTGSSPTLFHVSQQVTIIYDPANPVKAVIMSFGQLWTGPILLGLMGLGFCIFTAVFTWLVFTAE